ncbi:hypothetical protein M404DRAFT_826986 [Pisolithus tinctorius Marx 270]|uniref:Uncharacterized protein n=1 Tax=Pisolithus tinctorius Marx 270 TaxID=870435 RepID=A0A0C3IP18_PISTI|nr:hypothetical protein M404DRAFT_826986 [Pisolithus tinctorius Marx 270]
MEEVTLSLREQESGSSSVLLTFTVVLHTSSRYLAVVGENKSQPCCAHVTSTRRKPMFPCKTRFSNRDDIFVIVRRCLGKKAFWARTFEASEYMYISLDIFHARPAAVVRC